MRISFVGGGTDLADFYRSYPGCVISTAIDQYVYVAVNRTPLVKKVSARYSVTEMVDHPRELKNDRIREALLDLGLESNIEVGMFSTMPGNTGLGSSSSFSVALIRGLHSSLGRKTDQRGIAEAASRLEIELVGEPIGKQDHYAAAFGSMNTLRFNSDHSVDINPVLLDYRKRMAFEDHLLLFFTGVKRLASNILSEQRSNIGDKMDTLKAMADSVPEFRDRLLRGDFKGLGGMLQANWLRKKTLASGISNNLIDELYNVGMDAGAWGGKVLGAGGGGCVLFLTPFSKKDKIQNVVQGIAKKNNLSDFEEIPVHFVQAGVEVLSNSSRPYPNFS